ncbi:Crp/Fnr family transcriptional regulator [Mucilaginibacter sp. UR6-1]|uniref:Crp/Fnr family transcriptional regulator n=1 Tax=Mucilaginibacter sp. UR6-1 TaxID=1435643 RepID=UPI001E4E8289|nr:Crp/Fnr family transcriptional regulator [Mucilaginibacter sp. UR6-1]MCC8409471.1 Crp/Fnr family transcriptional regulator [Mucilaginibacter sp. UR6-1]
MNKQHDLASFRNAIFNMQVLDEDCWAALAEILLLKTLKKGDYLTSEGGVEKNIYFINEGCTRSFFSRDGKEFTVDFQWPAEFTTAYYSLITSEPSNVNIEALTDMQVIVINYLALLRLYQQYADLERVGRKIAEAQYIRRLRKEMDMQSLTAEERYTKLLDSNKLMVARISVKHLSSYLGIQPESLSRIRKRYARN